MPVGGIRLVAHAQFGRKLVIYRAEDAARSLPALQRSESAQGCLAGRRSQLGLTVEEIGRQGEESDLRPVRPGLPGRAVGRGQRAIRKLHGQRTAQAGLQQAFHLRPPAPGVAVEQDIRKMEARKEVVRVGVARFLVKTLLEQDVSLEVSPQPGIELLDIEGRQPGPDARPLAREPHRCPVGGWALGKGRQRVDARDRL